MLGPTWLKLRLGVDEVVTTLLLNFVALLFVGMLLEGPMQGPDEPGLAAIRAGRRRGRAARAGQRTRSTPAWSWPWRAVLVWLYLERTVWGFETRAVGGNARAPRASPACRWLACCCGPG